MPRIRIPEVKHLIAVASGKGGVGKTTVTVNLALALQRLGAAVGIFDADIYGPNVPLMLGVHQRRVTDGFVPLVRGKEAAAYIQPVERFGVKIMSVGLLVGEEQAINPLASDVGLFAVRTLRDVMWGNLDYLLLDLPPSAGQPQEALLQQVALAGAIIVTTPQDLSLLDSGRALQLFSQSAVPILGVVENMSYFICPTCTERHEIFQHSAQWRVPALENAPVLGRIPLTAAISKGINQASPLMSGTADSPQAQAFMEIATAVHGKLNGRVQNSS